MARYTAQRFVKGRPQSAGGWYAAVGPHWDGRPYPVPSQGWLRTRVGYKKHNWVTFCAPAARQNDIPPDTGWELWVCILQKHATLRL